MTEGPVGGQAEEGEGDENEEKEVGRRKKEETTKAKPTRSAPVAAGRRRRPEPTERSRLEAAYTKAVRYLNVAMAAAPTRP